MFSGSDEGRQDRDGGEVEGVRSDGAGCVHAHGQELQDTAQAFQGVTVMKERCDTRKDIMSWLKEKTQVALDESFYDLSNMQVVFLKLI